VVEHWGHNPKVKGSTPFFIKVGSLPYFCIIKMYNMDIIVKTLGIVSVFYSIIITMSLFVVFSKNSLHSIISIILVFITASCLLFVVECEFLALLFLVIYVGAIAVLFLFVVMMLDLNTLATYQKSNNKYLIFAVPVAISFLYFVRKIVSLNYESNSYNNNLVYNCYNNFFVEDALPEILVIGQVLYISYSVQFLLAGLILSLTLFGVIYLAPKGGLV
jgi:NADH-quinone oxidoreductase subunit J